MAVILRNTLSGEMATLDGDSNTVEYQTKILERRSGDGRPLWEETGIHDLMGLQDRLNRGALQPEDIGDAGQPFNTILGEAAPVEFVSSGDIDRQTATPTEVASDAGRAALDDGEAFVPTVLNEDGSLITTTDVRVKPLTPPIESKTDMDSMNADTEMGDTDDDDFESAYEGNDDEGHDDVNPEHHTLEALQGMAADAGVPTSGTKAELAERLNQHNASGVV